MSVTPSPPVVVHVQSGLYRLCSFDRQMAPVVAGWVRDAEELFKLAPKTPPPLTATKVVEWPGADGCPLMLARESVARPLGSTSAVSCLPDKHLLASGAQLPLCGCGPLATLGYLELNPMPTQEGHLWMGHCVVDPEHRAHGLGGLMVTLMLDHAFDQRHAGRVSLVVFPDNVPALCCYRRVGFIDAGEQFKTFPTSSRHHRMLRMTIDRKRYDQLRRKAGTR